MTRAGWVKRTTLAATLSVALAVVVVAASLSAGSANVTSHAGTSLHLVYGCLTDPGSTGKASAPRRVDVSVAAALPASGAADQPIQPTGVTVTTTLPRTITDSLLPANTTVVSATTGLTIAAVSGRVASTSVWQGHSRATPVPTSGDLVLRSSGAVPPLSPRRPGTLTVGAGTLTVLVTARAAGSAASPGPSSPNPGGPASSATGTQLQCTPLSSQDLTLSSVAITKGRGAGRGAAGTPDKQPCPPQPKNGYQKNPHFPLPKPPPGSTIIHPPFEAGCAYVVGYADASKLHGAMLLGGGPTGALTNLSINARVVTNRKQNYFQSDNYGVILYQGHPQFPPATATFLEFGFMPVTATVVLSQIGTLNSAAVGPYNITQCHHQACPTINTISSMLSLRIESATQVNGVPLAVGTQCRTVSAFPSVLTGSSATKPPYSIFTGGPLSGMVDIPDFQGCGVGEDLNTLFDASISGPQNFTLLTQGKVCFVIGGHNCPPKKPVPLRTFQEP